MPCENGAEPIQLPWTNISLTNDLHGIARGIQINVGTPPQFLALRPYVNSDNTYLNGIRQCPLDNNTRNCVAVWGGVYDAQLSHTYIASIQSRWNGTRNAEILDAIVFNDVVQISENDTIFGLPMFTNTSASYRESFIGLGSDSSFIGAASPPSSAWGLWTGSRSIENPMDGMLILGGYDISRVAGDFVNFSISNNLFDNRPCPLYTRIIGLSYDYPGGSSSLFTNTQEEFEGCLAPESDVIELSQDIFDSFAKVTNATYNSTLGQLTYPRNHAPQGNLSITLGDGPITIIIPTEEIFSLARAFDSEGVYNIIDENIVIAEVQNFSSQSQGLALIGMPFLTMNYLLVNTKQHTFSLAPAVRDIFSTNPSNIIAVCDDGSIGTSMPTSSLVTTPSSTNAAPTGGHHNENTAAIAGGAAGGAVGLIFLLAVAYYLLSARRKRKRRVVQSSTSEKTSDGLHPYPDDPTPQKAELATSNTRAGQQPSELKEQNIYEISSSSAPVELPAVCDGSERPLPQDH